MKKKLQSVPKWAAFVTFAVTTAVLGFSCGTGNSVPPPSVVAPVGNMPVAETICGAPTYFNVGRPLTFSELASAGNISFELREVHFRDVILRTPGSLNDIELAYRTEMRMENRNGVLTPVNQVVCNVQNRISRRGAQLSRVTIPVVGDLHLPSMRITVYDQASAESDNYNLPRISDVTFSNGNYFSFNNQNVGAYRQIRTISQYMAYLRARLLLRPSDRVELREMGEGWIGIYAEKTFGVEKAQLLILLGRAN